MRARSVAHNGILLGTVLLLGILTGCTGATDAAQPSPTPSSTTATADDIAAAKAAYLAYVDAYNGIDLNEPRSWENLGEVSVDPLRSRDASSLKELHDSGMTRSGATHVALLEVDKSAQGTKDNVRLNACVDLSRVVYRDAAGAQRQPPGFTPTRAVSVTVVTDPQNSGWRVSRFDGREGDPKCE